MAGKQRSGPASRQPKVSRRQADEARAQLAAGGLSHQQRRKLRAVTGAWDSAASQRRSQVRHLGIVLGGTLVAMALVAVFNGLVPAIEAANGHGTAGTFTAGSQPCISRRVGCRWSGTFRSADGVTLRHVAYDGTLPAGDGGGSSVPAVFPGGAVHVVYPRGSSRAWITDVLVMVLVGGIVGFLLWIMPLGLGKRETPGAVV